MDIHGNPAKKPCRALNLMLQAYWVTTDWLISCLSQQRRVSEAPTSTENA